MSFNFQIKSKASFDADSMREKLFGKPRQNLSLRPSILILDDKPVAADCRPAKSVRRLAKSVRLRKSAASANPDQTPAPDQIRRRLPVEYLGHLISNEQQSDGKWIASFVRIGGDLENARRSASHPASHMAFAEAKRQIDAALSDPSLGQREFQRMPVALDGMMFAAKATHECQLVDLSGGGARLRLAAGVAVEGEMTLYIQGFGRFRAVVVRSAGPELSVRFVSDEETMLALLKGLTSYVQGFDAPHTRLRKEVRVAAPIAAICRDSDGAAISCQIINASMRSMSISMTERPRIGALVTLGKTKVRVMRHHDQGIAVQCLPAPSAKTSRFNLKEEE